MMKAGERQYKTYLALTGAEPSTDGFTVTHLRIEVVHNANRRAYVLSVQGVERKELSEACRFPDAGWHYGTLADAPRYSAKQLQAWASVIETCIREEKHAYWDQIVAAAAAYGGAIAK
jgi:hypothetical protein